MANNKIEIDLYANDQATASLEKIKKNLDSVAKKATKSQRSVGGSIGRFGGLARIAGVIAVVTAAYKAIFKPIVEREKYIAGLKTVSTSQDDYTRSLNYLGGISKTLPFHINELTKSFTFFRKKGIDPLNSDIMKAVGNTAAALGQEFSQVGNTLGHVMLGDFAYLKNIGMAATQNGKGVDVEYFDKSGKRHIIAFSDKHNRQAIVNHLAKELNAKYAGAAENMSKTLSGSLIRIKNSWLLLMGAVGDSNAFQVLKGFFASIADFVESLANNKALITTLRVIEVVVTSLLYAAKGVAKVLWEVVKHIGTIFKKLFGWAMPSLSEMFSTDTGAVKTSKPQNAVIDLNIHGLPVGATSTVENANNISVNENLIFSGVYSG